MVHWTDHCARPRSVLKGVECISVDRGASGSSHDSVLDNLTKRARGANGVRTQVVVFPEGAWRGPRR